MKRLYNKDHSYFPIIMIFLMCLGLIMIYSSSAMVAQKNFGDQAYFLKRQSLHIILGIFAFYLGSTLSTEKWRSWAYPIYLTSLALLILVLIPSVGVSVGGARRWIPVFLGRIQPSEIFKFALVVYLAMSLAKKGPQMLLFRIGIIPHLILPGIAMVLLMAEPDFGSTVLVAMVTFILLFLGGARIAYLFAAIVISIPLAVHSITSSPYRLQRVLAFLDPWAHRNDSGYQIVESLLSLGSGRIFGMGFGQGTAKLHFLPAAHTDFILSSIGEELGFIGISLIMLSFLAISFLGFRVSLRQTNPFTRYLAAGITSMITLQVIFNCFVVVGLIPTKGIAMPFISYGGSSLMVNCLMIGVLVRIDKNNKN